MKPRLSPGLHQQLILTPQLRQAIRLLQLSAVELDAEIAEARHEVRDRGRRLVVVHGDADDLRPRLGERRVAILAQRL